MPVKCSSQIVSNYTVDVHAVPLSCKWIYGSLLQCIQTMDIYMYTNILPGSLTIHSYTVSLHSMCMYPMNPCSYPTQVKEEQGSRAAATTTHHMNIIWTWTWTSHEHEHHMNMNIIWTSHEIEHHMNMNMNIIWT